jgi:hypothetical protein
LFLSSLYLKKENLMLSRDKLRRGEERRGKNLGFGGA